MSTVETAPEPRKTYTDRCYVVLEEKTLADLVLDAGGFVDAQLQAVLAEVVAYRVIARKTAKNATAVYRTVVRETLGEETEGSMNLVAVSERTWKPRAHGQFASGVKFVSG